MEEGYMKFVSKDSYVEARKHKKELLKRALDKAQKEKEFETQRLLQKEQRGDTKWMNPSLNNRLEGDSSSSNEEASKKKRKKKKAKKEKKTNEVQESADEWDEVSSESATSATIMKQTEDLVNASRSPVEIAQEITAQKRDEWMTSTSLFDVVTTSVSGREKRIKSAKEEKRRLEREEQEAILRARELNPQFKQAASLPDRGRDVSNSAQTAAESTTNTSVGDGGRSWIHKAYERAKERARQDGVPLEEIVCMQWGSMAKLELLLKSADKQSASERRVHASSKGWRKSDDSFKPFRSLEPKNAADPVVGTSGEKSHVQVLPARAVRGPHLPQLPLDQPDSSQDVNRSWIAQGKLCGAEATSGTEILKESKDELIDSSIDEESGSSAVEEKVISSVPLSENERNNLAARILRAELMGDEELAQKLRSELESGVTCATKEIPSSPSRIKKTPKTSSGEESAEEDVEQNTVLLTRSDKHGNLYPVALETNSEDLNSKKKRGRKKLATTHGQDGKRVRYFEDDDRLDLKTMVQREKLTSASDQHAMMSRLSSRHLGKPTGEDYTLDDMFEAASALKGNSKADDRRSRELAIAEHKRRESKLSSCHFCLDGPNTKKHLIIAIGIKAYLAVPSTKSLTDGHCLIIPIQHVSGQTYLDEDVVQEVQIFKKGLSRMFSDKHEDIVFMETCKNLKHLNHCIVECVPVPKDVGDMAPVYFKKAISESESEWSQNKKLIDVSSANGVAKAVPKGLPYFSVEFGLDGGFAHVIEEEASFPHYFGKEVIGGMLDLEPRSWRKPVPESFEQQKHKVLLFADCWKPYDWTQRLKSS